jgi:thioredoxin reductase (NADPH)
MKTNVEGVFAAGDVTDSAMRQMITAAGEGAIAAKGVHEFLMNKK